MCCPLRCAEFVAAEGLTFFRDVLLFPIPALENAQRLSVQIMGYLIRQKGDVTVPAQPHEYEREQAPKAVSDEMGQLKVRFLLLLSVFLSVSTRACVWGRERARIRKRKKERERGSERLVLVYRARHVQQT